MKIKGKVVQVMPVQSGVSQRTGNEWVSQDFILEYATDKDGRFPKKVCLNVYGKEKIEGFNLHVGMQATFWVDIDAKEYKGRWYNSINCYKFSTHDDDGVGQQAPQQETFQQPQQPRQEYQGGQAYQQTDRLYRPENYANPFAQPSNGLGGGNGNDGVPF